MQRVLNCAAHVVTRVRKYEHITPVLASLHWLPSPQRIEFNVLLFTCKALHGLAPDYLLELLVWHTAPWSLRSNDPSLPAVPMTRLKFYLLTELLLGQPKCSGIDSLLIKDLLMTYVLLNENLKLTFTNLHISDF